MALKAEEHLVGTFPKHWRLDNNRKYDRSSGSRKCFHSFTQKTFKISKSYNKIHKNQTSNILFFLNVTIFA